MNCKLMLYAEFAYVEIDFTFFSCIENDLMETGKVKVGREEERPVTAVMSKLCIIQCRLCQNTHLIPHIVHMPTCFVTVT